jgi:adenosylcobinamide-phosphate synthase
MMRSSVVAASYALDWIIGDPEWLPHPVRVMGWTVNAAERVLRRCGSGRHFELAAGGLLGVSIPAAAFVITAAMIRRATFRHWAFGAAVEVWLASTCLATRDLLGEVAQVLHALNAGDVSHARLRLARIVGRDTGTLKESEICRAVIETLAESLSDGIIAPLIYLALGGVPLAMAYKTVNTLDSMIGHRDEQYLYFGRVSARMDDAVNWLPARISALLICIAAESMSANRGFEAGRIWLRDGSQHASPNAGQVESAMAGALGVRLGGENHYEGERIVSPHLGREFPKADRVAAGGALKLVATASLLGFAAVWLFTRGNRYAR